MNWSAFKREFVSKKAIHIALILFMMFSACLSVVSVIVASQTITSIQNLYEVAQPPHFLQMHKGEIQQEEVDAFMSSNQQVESWQTVQLLNVYGENIIISSGNETRDMGDCLLDISLVKQNQEKDLLLNEKHEKVTLQKGEIGIPILLKNQYDIQIGDEMTIVNHSELYTYTVTTFILDAQMNSPMVSSTRILLSDEDYNQIESTVGDKEYIIEVYFADKGVATEFQTLYENGGMPKNGQAVNYKIIFILSALTDMVMVFLMLLISVLLILVSFLCLKYTIMAALEEELSEIGTMKAIGFSFKDIRSYYLNKYRMLSMIGVFIGFVVAFFVSQKLTQHIQETFGQTQLSLGMMLLGAIAALCVYGLIMLRCRRILRRIKKVSIFDALVSGNGYEKKPSKVKNGLYKTKLTSIDLSMSLRELRGRFKQWSVILIVVWLIYFMMIVPINLMNTFHAPEFITYMGSSLEDIYIELENFERLLENRESVTQMLEISPVVASYDEIKNVSMMTMDPDGKPYNIHIDCSINSGKDLEYLEGNAPKESSEIALSYLNAQALSLEVGDELKLTLSDDTTLSFKVSGIYQDVTSGGYTAKSNELFDSVPAEKYSYSVNLKKGVSIEETVDQWSNQLEQGISVNPMDAFIQQTLGGVVDQLQRVVVAIVILGIGISALITILFLKLRLAKDASQIAILRAIGFSGLDVKKHYLIKTVTTALVGTIFGMITVSFFGNLVINGALSLSGLGITSVSLVPNLWMMLLVSPILILLSIAGFTWMTLKATEQYHIMTLIKE